MNSLEFLINIAIIGLLIPTIMYTYKLNRSLIELRKNQSALKKLVEDLNEATFKAEHSIPKLKSATINSSANLKEVVENASAIKDDLIFINQRANNLADRLETVISENRSKENFGLNKNNKENERAEAEMELLKALRSIK